MNDNIVIKAEGIGKKYILSHQIEKREELLSTLIVKKGRDLLRLGANLISTPFSGKTVRKRELEEFWALDDVSFEIAHGDRVGIIGRNGAGKSTLLKILSRITEPTKGRVTVKGRVATLLEVGTGFHSELTGRENIYLNGAILGMGRNEIRRKFDEIVSFAEVEKFLDTPVKRYSSGMYVRLAFAVAAHLEPDILVIDEVLAVGDAQFQKKCLGKMEEVSRREGRTVLFVSHNIGAVARLCHNALWLDSGKVVKYGGARELLDEYGSSGGTSYALWTRNSAPGEFFSFKRIELASVAGGITATYNADESIEMRIFYKICRHIPACQISVRLLGSEGEIILTTADTDIAGSPAIPREPGEFSAICVIPPNLLTPGSYAISVAAHFPFNILYDQVEQPVRFNVTQAGWLGNGDGRVGVISPLFAWNTEKAGR